MTEGARGIGPWLLPVVLLVSSWAAPVVAQDPGNEPGLELTSPVRQQLRLLTEAWLGWTRAYYQGEARGRLERRRPAEVDRRQRRDDEAAGPVQRRQRLRRPVGQGG